MAVIMTFFATVALIFIISLELINAKDIIYGTSINGVTVSGMTKFQAKIELQKKIAQYDNTKFLLLFDEDKWEATTSDLGLKFYLDEAINEAFNAGRDNNPFIGLKKQLSAFFFGKEIVLASYTDASVLDEFIESRLKDLETPVQDRTIFYNNKTRTFWINPPSNGKLVSRQAISNSINDFASNRFSHGEIKLTLIAEEPKITEEKARQTLETAKKITTTDYFLTYKEKSFPVEKEDLLEALEFGIKKTNDDYNLEPVINEKKVGNIIAPLAPLLNKEPQNAIFGADENNKIKEDVPSENGVEININKTAIALKDNILYSQKTEIIMDETPPKISKYTMEKMGITDFIGKGESNFKGSTNNRVHNIKIGASKFNNIFIEKDEEFSIVNALGVIDDTTGYKAELIIKSNKTVPEFGGGLCQVSTTIFRAAMISGLKITERYPHAYAVKYYAPQGFDATIYPPHPDLRFVNDTPEKILIQTRIEGTVISFYFFGKRDGREVKIIGPKTYSAQKDGSLKTWVTQEIYKDGELIREKTFWSSYKSPALYPIIRNPLD